MDGVLYMSAAVAKDDELISRIKSGDENSLELLIKEYFPKTFRKVRKLVPYDDAEDVTQDIFLNLISCIGNFEGKSGFATWFNSMVLNRIADYHRKMFRYKNRFVFEIDGMENVLKHDVDSQETNNDMEMEDLLMKLPSLYREILMLKLHNDMSFGEIASSLGIDYEAVRSRYRRGIQFAAKKLKQNPMKDMEKDDDLYNME